MLGHALYETKKFGFPLEYANPANLAEWKKRLGVVDIVEVISELQNRRTSANGVFGIKIHYSHIRQFGGFSKMVELFPNAYYVLLSRRDVLGQAISLSIAKQTGVWIYGQKSMKENPEYSFVDIDNCFRSILLDNSAWRYALLASGSNFIELNFEEVQNNISRAIEAIARFIEIDIHNNDILKQQKTHKQSNKINEDWKKKFIFEMNRRTEFSKMDIAFSNALERVDQAGAPEQWTKKKFELCQWCRVAWLRIAVVLGIHR